MLAHSLLPTHPCLTAVPCCCTSPSSPAPPFMPFMPFMPLIPSCFSTPSMVVMPVAQRVVCLALGLLAAATCCSLLFHFFDQQSGVPAPSCGKGEGRAGPKRM